MALCDINEEYLYEAKCSPGKKKFECGDLNELRHRRQKPHATYPSIFKSSTQMMRETSPECSARYDTRMQGRQYLETKFSSSLIIKDDGKIDLDSPEVRKFNAERGCALKEAAEPKEVKLALPIKSKLMRNRKNRSLSSSN